MKDWTLEEIIEHFDACIKGIDFKEMPARDSGLYRIFLFTTADLVVFSDGMITPRTECMVDIFHLPEVKESICDLKAINALSQEKLVRFRFYMDLKDVCFPLYNGDKMDWTAWPWNMSDGSNDMDNMALYSFITKCDWPNLSAAMLKNLAEQKRWDYERFSIIGGFEIANTFLHTLKPAWNKTNKKEDELNALSAAVTETAYKYWEIENHMYVGKLLGFDNFTQSIYDAFSSCIDGNYNHLQIGWAKELSAWIRENVNLENNFPDEELVDELYNKILELYDKYHIFPSDEDLTWSSITLDILEWNIDTDISEEDEWNEE